MREVYFDTKNSYTDYNMFTLTLDTPSPEMRKSSIEIAGRDGEIDFSEAVAGYPVFINRTLSFRFRAVGDLCERIAQEFISDVHGKIKKVRIVNPDVELNDLKYYEGRVSASVSVNAGYYIDLSVEVDADPFRTKGEDEAQTETIDGETEVTVNVGGDRPAQPTLVLSSEMQIEYNGVVYTRSQGTHKALFSLQTGENTITFIGNGTVTINWLERYF